MQRKRKVKIIATLGPSSSDPAVLRALFEAGADVFRLNFSHGSHEDHRRNLESVRALEREAGHPIGVLMDLQGPKLRVGRFAAGTVELPPGARFRRRSSVGNNSPPSPVGTLSTTSNCGSKRSSAASTARLRTARSCSSEPACSRIS